MDCPCTIAHLPELENLLIFLHQIWHIDTSGNELLPSGSFGFQNKFILRFHGNNFDIV